MSLNRNQRDGKPVLLTRTALAQTLGIHSSTVRKWVAQYPPDGDRYPTPEPDAFCEMGALHRAPMWSIDRLPEWEHWVFQQADRLEATSRNRALGVYLKTTRPTRPQPDVSGRNR